MARNNSIRVFISYASENKAELARPLARALRNRGFRVWFDEFALRLGDSLKRSIDGALADTDYGVVVLSPQFFAKQWTREELDGLVVREVAEKRKVIIPVWHNIDHAVVAKYSPTLAGKLAVSTTIGIAKMASLIKAAILSAENPQPTREVKVKSPAGGYLWMIATANPPGYDQSVRPIDLETIMDRASAAFQARLKNARRKKHDASRELPEVEPS